MCRPNPFHQGFVGDEPSDWPEDGYLDVLHDIYGYREEYQGADCRVVLLDRAGANPAEWPEDLRVRLYPCPPRDNSR